MHITVVTTLYNYARYIGECVESFLKQDYKDSEMVIVDDGSTDDPYAALNKYLFDYPDRIRYERLPKNKGEPYAKNVGLKLANGSVIVMLDADDMLTEKSLSRRIAKINEGVDFVHGPVLDLKNGQLGKSKLWQSWLESPVYKHVHAQSVMLRKGIHSEIGMYDETLPHKNDREMWARIFNRGYKIGTVPEPVSIYRLHDKQKHKTREKLAMNKELQKRVLKIIEHRKTNLNGVNLL